MKDVLRVLNAMNEHFSDESKWKKGYTMADDGPCCVLQAMARACKHDFELQTRVSRYLYDTARVAFMAEWNDADERTFADVKKLIADALLLVLPSAKESSNG